MSKKTNPPDSLPLTTPIASATTTPTTPPTPSSTTALSTPATTPTTTGTAIATYEATHDELAELGDVDLGDDGLGQVDREDIRIAAYTLNMKGKGADGRPYPIDAYYNTVDETTKLRVNAAFLHLHKTNMWSRYNELERRSDIKCRSYDRVTGTMDNGTQRPCAGCPDAEWRRDAEGKRTRNCSPVYNLFAFDRDAQIPFVTRYKRTALPVIKAHLQKHHIGRRIVRGVRSNYPLHVFAVELSARLSDNGNYALPVIARGAVLARAEVEFLRDNARTLREQVIPILSHVESNVAASGAGDAGDVVDEGDTSFEPEKYAADAGKDFA